VLARCFVALFCAFALLAASGSAALGVDRARLDAGDRLMATKQYEQALAHWNKLLETEPNDPGLLLRAGLAESMLGRFEQAQSLLLKARSAAPDDPKIALNLALLAQRRGRVDEAERALLKIAAVKPWYPNVFLALGRIAEERGEYKKAIAYYVREINNSSHGDAWRHYMLLKRKLDGPAFEPPAALLPVLIVLAVLLAVILVAICARHPEKLENFTS